MNALTIQKTQDHVTQYHEELKQRMSYPILEAHGDIIETLIHIGERVRREDIPPMPLPDAKRIRELWPTQEG